MTESPRPKQVGDIVNGYRWDGRQWVPLTPVRPPYLGPQPPPGQAMNGYPAQPPPARSSMWAPPGRTVPPPVRTTGWTPPRAGGWTPGGAGAPATRGRKPVWLLWALAALVVVIVAFGVISSGGPLGGGGDADVKAGVAVIARGCSAFVGATGSGPGVSDVRPDGAVAQYVANWPTNPFTGGPMAPGTQPGDYRFSTAIRMPGGEYRGYVSGVLSNGETYSVEFTY